MATLRAATTTHRHTELFSGIITNQYEPDSSSYGRVERAKMDYEEALMPS